MSIRRFRRVFAIGMALVGAALLGAGPVSATGAGSGTGTGTTSGVAEGPGVTTAAPATGPTGPTAPGAGSAPMVISLCQGYGSYLGIGTHRVAAGKNLLVVEVCGDPVNRTVSMVRASYIKVDGPRAERLRLHWRWADKAGAVRGGGDDDNGAFVLDPQSEDTFVWPYSQPVAPLAPSARCVVGVLSQGTAHFVTEPVCL